LKKEIVSEESNNLKLELPLKEGLLKSNFGIPIIFDINKSDIVLSNTDRKRFEEDSEFIIKHIRNLAIGCMYYILSYYLYNFISLFLY
jgi:AAA+ superfamily predicted ATPase